MTAVPSVRRKGGKTGAVDDRVILCLDCLVSRTGMAWYGPMLNSARDHGRLFLTDGVYVRLGNDYIRMYETVSVYTHLGNDYVHAEEYVLPVF